MKQDIDHLITKALRERPEAEREADIQQILSQDENEAWQMANRSRRNTSWMKIAAMFIGVLFITAISYAAIHYFIENGEQRIENLPTENKPTAEKAQSSTLNVQSDSIPAEPRVFENMPLKDIVAELARYYQTEYEVANAKAAQLRLYYPWNPQMSLQHVIDELNRFENVNLKLNGQRITID